MLLSLAATISNNFWKARCPWTQAHKAARLTKTTLKLSAQVHRFSLDLRPLTLHSFFAHSHCLCCCKCCLANLKHIHHHHTSQCNVLSSFVSCSQYCMTHLLQYHFYRKYIAVIIIQLIVHFGVTELT